MSSANADYARLDTEEEFKDRGRNGLKAEPPKQTEAMARAKFTKMMVLMVLVISPVSAWALYLLAKFALPGQQQIYDAKFAFIYDHQLGYVFVVWFVIYLARIYVGTINANGARAPTGLDRPDQHAYMVMAADGPLKGAPYCLLANTGVLGRFNRAQRAAFNMDESLPLFISGLILAGAVLGPLALFPALLAAYGRVRFANLYKESLKARSAGFMPSIIGEAISAGMVFWVCGLKGLLGPRIPV